jgi:hypothetical protein
MIVLGAIVEVCAVSTSVKDSRMMVERDLDHSSRELLHGGVVLTAHRRPVTLLVGSLTGASSFIKEHPSLDRSPLYPQGIIHCQWIDYIRKSVGPFFCQGPTINRDSINLEWIHDASTPNQPS